MEKTILFINSFATPQEPAPRKTEKHHSEKQSAIDCTLKPIKRSGVKHSVGKVWVGRKHLANYDVLHLDTSNSSGRAAAAARDVVF